MSAKIVLYLPKAPRVYAGEIDGAVCVNMCYQCPRAKECALVKVTPAQQLSAEGCTCEDMPTGDEWRGTV